MFGESKQIWLKLDKSLMLYLNVPFLDISSTLHLQRAFMRTHASTRSYSLHSSVTKMYQLTNRQMS